MSRYTPSGTTASVQALGSKNVRSALCDEIAAQRLISVCDLIEAAGRSSEEDEMAAMLAVDVDTLRARLRTVPAPLLRQLVEQERMADWQYLNEEYGLRGARFIAAQRELPPT
jgi:hypothetical protein